MDEDGAWKRAMTAAWGGDVDGGVDDGGDGYGGADGGERLRTTAWVRAWRLYSGSLPRSLPCHARRYNRPARCAEALASSRGITLHSHHPLVLRVG